MAIGWPALSYEPWRATCDTLHAHTQVLGKLAAVLAPPEPQLQHAALRLSARGWETLALPARNGSGALVAALDLGTHEAVVEHSAGHETRIALTPNRPVAEVTREVLAAVGRLGGEVEIEGPPPGVDRRSASAKRRPELCQHEGRAGGCVEIVRDRIGVVGRVLVVLVERQLPRHLLGRGVDLDRPAHARHGLEHLARHLAHGPVGGERDPCLVAGAVLDDGLVRVQVKRRDDRARAVGRRQRLRLPAARAEPQGGVLELRRGRGQLHCELSEHLGVRVEGVAGRAPRAVGETPPFEGHAPTLLRDRARARAAG